MPILGLIGGVASGKSYMADLFARRGAAVIDADRLGHEALADPEVKRRLRELWGQRVFCADGSVSRPAVAALVFGDDAEAAQRRGQLEAMSHPVIRRLIQERIAEIYREDPQRLIVLDAAVMLESGWSALCDKLAFVDAPHDLRLRRTRSRGWTEADFRAREASQLPLAQKRAAANYVIPSGEDDHATVAAMERIRTELIKDTP